MASFFFMAPDPSWRHWASGALLFSLLLLGGLMVSTLRYPSFKKIDLRSRWSYRIALPLAAALAIVILDPPTFFIAAATVYTASGPLGFLAGRLRRVSSRDGETEAAQ